MSFIDLHCHPLPNIDDGVRSPSDGVALLVALRKAGFETVVATPHVRTGIWDNRCETRDAAAAVLAPMLAEARQRGEELPELLFAGEHMFDDVLHDLLAKGQALTYPGGGAALVEFPYENIPLRVELQLWRMARAGVKPVLAHPERYVPIQQSYDRFEELVGAGVWALLDVMSLVGAYGRRAQECAEKILARGGYFAACTDSHKPSDVAVVLEGIAALRRRVGDNGVSKLFSEGPLKVLKQALEHKG
jgi:protein-tyrosine phosphatase